MYGPVTKETFLDDAAIVRGILEVSDPLHPRASVGEPRGVIFTHLLPTAVAWTTPSAWEWPSTMTRLTALEMILALCLLEGTFSFRQNMLVTLRWRAEYHHHILFGVQDGDRRPDWLS